MENILITGGTGFIGKALCADLLAAGYNLYILTRKNTQEPALSTKKFYINNLAQLKDSKIDIIINLAGESIAQRWTSVTKKNIYNSRILITRDLISYIRSTKHRPKLLISGSAVGYYGTDPEKTFTEETKVSGSSLGFASSLCQAWESEAALAKELGVRTVLLRIGPVLEKDGGMLAKILPSFKLGLGTQIASGQQWLSWIDRDDLINLFLFIINHAELSGPLNATAPNPVTNQHFSLALAKAIKRPCFLRTPGLIFKLILGEMAAEIMNQGQKVVPQVALEHGFVFAYPTIEQSLAKIFNSHQN